MSCCNDLEVISPFGPSLVLNLFIKWPFDILNTILVDGKIFNEIAISSGGWISFRSFRDWERSTFLLPCLFILEPFLRTGERCLGVLTVVIFGWRLEVTVIWVTYIVNLHLITLYYYLISIYCQPVFYSYKYFIDTLPYHIWWPRSRSFPRHGFPFIDVLFN